MNWETKNITNSLRARFIKNMDIPIQVVKDPYFEYYLSLYDYQYHTMEKWDEFKTSLNNFNTEEEYFAAERQFADTMIFAISTGLGYDDFTKMDMKRFETSSALKKGNVFSEANVDKTFTSIDLVKANFQSLRYVDTNIVCNKDTYEELARLFTDIPHFIKSKKIRQVIFGNLCPQRQQTVQKYLISIIQAALIEGGIDTNNIIASSSDEIVVLGETVDLGFLPKSINVKVSKFKLEQLGTEKFKFLVKKDLVTHEAKIKGVNSAYIPEVLKFQMGVKAIDWDRMFYLDGRLCFFQESLF